MWMFNSYLVGGFNPSKEYESVGVTIPNIWGKNIHVPNHQSVIDALSSPKIPNIFPVDPALDMAKIHIHTEHTSVNTIRIPLESISSSLNFI